MTRRSCPPASIPNRDSSHSARASIFWGVRRSNRGAVESASLKKEKKEHEYRQGFDDSSHSARASIFWGVRRSNRGAVESASLKKNKKKQAGVRYR